VSAAKCETGWGDGLSTDALLQWIDCHPTPPLISFASTLPLQGRVKKEMTAPDLPAELKAALDARLHGLSRNDAAMRAALISRTYRDGGNSSAIRDSTDALAYALARMPATYAAVTASLNALCEIRPEFAPASLLDVGAGPGTAVWAAAEAFSSLTDFALLDANAALRALALDLFHDSTRLSGIGYSHREARAALADAEPADLVVASYLIGEIGDAERTALAALMWAKTRDTLLIVEPGTPAGYARVLAARGQLIAAGAHVAAPCPHDGQCLLRAPDWCHFTQRLPRSRAHQQIKGAELPFEDEKFAYVALTRAPVARHPARVLAQPVVSKVEVTAKLCTPDGLTIAKVPRRAKADYAAARRWRWGDGVMG
jgi:ribosomal protein RSM22 (predicted rRNA methylase)